MYNENARTIIERCLLKIFELRRENIRLNDLLINANYQWKKNIQNKIQKNKKKIIEIESFLDKTNKEYRDVMNSNIK